MKKTCIWISVCLSFSHNIELNIKHTFDIRTSYFFLLEEILSTGVCCFSNKQMPGFRALSILASKQPDWFMTNLVWRYSSTCGAIQNYRWSRRFRLYDYTVLGFDKIWWGKRSPMEPFQNHQQWCPFRLEDVKGKDFNFRPWKLTGGDRREGNGKRMEEDWLEKETTCKSSNSIQHTHNKHWWLSKDLSLTPFVAIRII